MTEGISDLERCKQCVHYYDFDDEYDWRHECKMETDHYKAKEEK